MYRQVLRPFLNIQRRPPYTHKPEYEHLVEENKELFISSVWYKNHWLWTQFKSFFYNMLKGREYSTVVFPYQLSLHHGLLSKRRVELMKTEDNFDPITWMMEMDSMFYGESDKAFFSLNNLQKNREIIKPFYPLSNLEYLSNKSKRSKKTTLKKQEGEIRLIGMDIALMEGLKNDSTVFQCIRLIPDNDGYVRHVSYIETMNGEHTEKQAIRLKQLHDDFEADYVIMDTLGNGISVFDACARVIFDEERDVEYPAWTSFNDERMKSRALDSNALPIIFSIKVTESKVNHAMAMGLRTDLENGKIKLLIDEITARDYLTDKKNFSESSVEEQQKMISPFIQTTSMINEMVNLEYKMQNSFVKVYEVRGGRKDRYSSLAYTNYFARILEEEMMSDEDVIDSDDDSIVIF